jgi:hypothetical protein
MGGEKKNWAGEIFGWFFLRVRKKFSDPTFKPY